MQIENRLSWNEYFMQVAFLIAKRSTCQRGKVGAVIVRENNILATGYNGSPKGLPHCEGDTCLIYKSIHPNGVIEENCMTTIHAEINAIAQAAKNGTAIANSYIYITSSPCINCLKVLINVGITKIFYASAYKIETIQRLIKLSNIELIELQIQPNPCTI